ncbi:MAG: SPOR domain-containing protein [Pseudomonadota bacterium]
MRDAVGRAVQDAQLDGATDPTVPIITPEEDLTIDTPTETQLAEARAIPRPVQRPNTPQVTRSAPRATEPLALPVDLDPATLPSGTRLVQLGAYDSATTAQAQWDLISARFEPYFQNRQRVIQRANVGGRTFYRLRVHGFKNRAEADRFCAALQAQNTDCIPALVR